MRVKQAAQILGVSPQTVRNLCHKGDIPYTLNTANQRIFKKQDIIDYKRKRQGLPPLTHKTYYYVRTSNKQDISLDNQINKLTQEYGGPDKIFKDTGSGLNDKRKGLNQLFNEIEKDDNKKTIYITNKDRITKFDYNYLERYFKSLNAEIVVLDSDETKEPLEILLQDFMILLASFSGKFYGLKGWKQRKQFLTDVQKEVDKHV